MEKLTGEQSISVLRVLFAEMLNTLPRDERNQFAASLRRVYTVAELEQLLPGDAIRLESAANEIWRVA